MPFILNKGESVTLQTPDGLVTLVGRHALTNITDAQAKYLKATTDFAAWVNKNFIVVSPTADVAANSVEASAEKNISAREAKDAKIKLDALAETIFAEQKCDKKRAYELAKERLAKEADKADQAGDADAPQLRAASKA